MNRPMSVTAAAAIAAATWIAPGLAQNPATAPPPATQAGAPGAANAPGRGRGAAPIVIGPSAPVPPEVAIPRPTPTELVEVNAAVRSSSRRIHRRPSRS